LVLGDAPGVLRIVAGVADQSGDSLGALATESLLDGPSGLAAGPDGTLYIADRQNSRILSVSSAGEIEALVDHSDLITIPKIRGPSDIALNAAGELLIADSESRMIWRLDLASHSLDLLAGQDGGIPGADSIPALEADLQVPIGIAVDEEGRIYFSESLGHRIRRLDSDGTLNTFAGTGLPGYSGDGGPARAATLNRPAGLDIAGNRLFIADSANQVVRVVDLGTSIIETVAGSGAEGFGGDGGPAVNAFLDGPFAVAVTNDARTLFIGDVNNKRVRVVNLETGTIDTFAGTGDDVYNGDLLAAGETSLASPQGLTTSPYNLLFIADTGHQIVRRTVLQIQGAR
jgi:hypothetical protein